MTEGLRLVGYVRVSTEDQAREGYSLEAQRTRIHAYADAHLHQLMGIHADEGISGRLSFTHKKREGIQAAIGCIERHEADGLVVLKLDRLSRRRDDILAIAARARKDHWHLLSVSDHLDTSNAAGRFMLAILASLAEMESEQIGERVTVGMTQALIKRHLISRFTPFGMRLESGGWEAVRQVDAAGKTITQRLVADPAEMQILNQILTMTANEATPQEIATALNAQNRWSPRKATPWHRNAITKILKTHKKHQDILATQGGRDESEPSSA